MRSRHGWRAVWSCGGVMMATAFSAVAARVPVQSVVSPATAVASAPATSSMPADGTLDGPLIDVQAQTVLRRMSALLSSFAAFTYSADVEYDEIDATGQKLQYYKFIRVECMRPDKLRCMIEGDIERRHLLYDGKQLAIADLMRNVYALLNMPATLEDTIEQAAVEYDIVLPMAELLSRDAYAALTDHVITGRHLGVHRVGSARCHHLAFMQEEVDWQIWIDDGNRPFPRKLLITYKQEFQAPQYVATFTNWDAGARFPAAYFQYAPPANMQRIEVEPADGEAPPAATQPAGGR